MSGVGVGVIVEVGVTVGVSAETNLIPKRKKEKTRINEILICLKVIFDK